MRPTSEDVDLVAQSNTSALSEMHRLCGRIKGLAEKLDSHGVKIARLMPSR